MPAANLIRRTRTDGSQHLCLISPTEAKHAGLLSFVAYERSKTLLVVSEETFTWRMHFTFVYLKNRPHLLLLGVALCAVMWVSDLLYSQECTRFWIRQRRAHHWSCGWVCEDTCTKRLLFVCLCVCGEKRLGGVPLKRNATRGQATEAALFALFVAKTTHT